MSTYIAYDKFEQSPTQERQAVRLKRVHNLTRKQAETNACNSGTTYDMQYPHGVFLRGPPGKCGKTLLANAIAESESSQRVMDTLLTELDVLGSRNFFHVIAATNRLDMIDPAMLAQGAIRAHNARRSEHILWEKCDGYSLPFIQNPYHTPIPSSYSAQSMRR
ncbi:hypothetical protein F4604DRAFT_1903870 [Suillus subluteus]|nr:hypothetical protein F4604DRAFT_1903870 [Suillus subluteus]